MSFPFLNNTNTVLNKYYVNDDVKINNIRQNIHTYQKKNSLNLYGIASYHIKQPYGTWGQYYTFGEYIYRHYGVRR